MEGPLCKDCSFRPDPLTNMAVTGDSCLLIDRDKMSNLYRGPSIDAAYQVSVHLAMQFQRRFVRNQPIRKCSFHPDPLTNMATTGNSCF
jgi:hypothetical protein